MPEAMMFAAIIEGVEICGTLLVRRLYRVNHGGPVQYQIAQLQQPLGNAACTNVSLLFRSENLTQCPIMPDLVMLRRCCVTQHHVDIVAEIMRLEALNLIVETYEKE